MTQAAAELITANDGEIREKYSGRGMFGKETSAVIFEDDTDFYTAIADAIEQCWWEENKEDGDILLKALKELKTDNMGRSIIYY